MSFTRRFKVALVSIPFDAGSMGTRAYLAARKLDYHLVLDLPDECDPRITHKNMERFTKEIARRAIDLGL